MFPIFRKLGGEEAVLKILQTARASSAGRRPLPGVYAIRKWKQERRIPPINVEILQKEAEQRGIEWFWDDFRATSPIKSHIASAQEGGSK
jgi:hypothetical protein